MAIYLKDLIEALSRDVHEAYERIKKNDLKIAIPEIEVSLNFEVEVEGEEEKAPKATVIRRGTKIEPLAKYVITEKILKEKGIAFRKIKTTPQTKEHANFTIRIVFIPEE